MAGEEPLSFEEMQVHIAAIEKNQKSILKFYKAQEDDDDDKMKEARKAIEDPGDYTVLKSKKHMSQNDDEDKEKDAQNNDKKKDEEMEARMKRAVENIAQEEDKEKRKDMAKAAQEMMDEHKKNSKKNTNQAQENQKDEDDEKKEARIASLEKKTKSPIVTDILKVASIINPKELKSITKDLKTASLEEVENLWDKHYKSFSASLGVKESPAAQARFVPFQMNASLEGVDDEDNMYIASTPKEYSQLDTEKLYDKVTEMYQ